MHGQGNAHGKFSHFDFIDPEFMKCTFDLMLDDAHGCLLRRCPMAYYWFASRESDLYTYWSPRIEHLIGEPITPASQAFRVRRAGLPTYPDAGITNLVIDTSDVSDRWYGAPDISASEYLDRIATDAEGFRWLDGALSNGVRLQLRGEHAYLLRQALKLYVQCTSDDQHAAWPIRMQHQAGRNAILHLASQRAQPPSVALAA